jgi:hypothetical protein
VLRESAELEAVAPIGFRDGGTVALALAGDASRLVLVSPPESLDLQALSGLSAEALFVIAEADPARARWGRHCAQTGDRLEVIEGADVAWNRGLPQLARAVVEFLDTD